MTERETDTARKERWNKQKPTMEMLQCSSCFGTAVCRFVPCACAQSLVDLAWKPIEVAELQPDADSPGLWIGFKTADDRKRAMELFRHEN